MFSFSTKDLFWDAPVFKRIPDEVMFWGYRIHLENPPFPPAIDASVDFLERSSGQPPERPYVRWVEGESLYMRTDNGYEMSWQELERDEERGVIRFGVP